MRLPASSRDRISAAHRRPARESGKGWSSAITVARTRPMADNHRQCSARCKSEHRNPISRSGSEPEKRQILFREWGAPQNTGSVATIGSGRAAPRHTSRQRPRASFRQAKGRPCSNIHTGPHDGGTSKAHDDHLAVVNIPWPLRIVPRQQQVMRLHNGINRFAIDWRQTFEA